MFANISCFPSKNVFNNCQTHSYCCQINQLNFPQLQQLEEIIALYAHKTILIQIFLQHKGIQQRCALGLRLRLLGAALAHLHPTADKDRAHPWWHIPSGADAPADLQKGTFQTTANLRSHCARFQASAAFISRAKRRVTASKNNGRRTSNCRNGVWWRNEESVFCPIHFLLEKDRISGLLLSSSNVSNVISEQNH